MSRVIVCDTSGRPGSATKPKPPRFDHRDDCPCHGFLALATARALKRLGYCRCDVPMEDR